MLNFALIGAGRIGKMHARIINAHPACNLKFVYDVNKEFSSQVSKETGAQSVNSPEEAINASEINAVFIASATPTHIKFITMSVKANKAVFCEKPIDLDINRVNQCMKEIKDTIVPIQIGFNRRFDNSHAKIQQAWANGEIGNLEMLIITSRDPEPPGIEYLKAAGGFFRDTTIHDFDLSRFILGNDPIIQISAFGEQLISDEVKEEGDHDTAMFIMKSKSGVLCHINNSRHSSYGYDQRVELFGSKGMIISDNQTPTSVTRYNDESTNSKDPILNFFIERYDLAYKNQLDNFVNCIIDKKSPTVNFEDGRIALIIANAAYESLKNKKSVKIDYS